MSELVWIKCPRCKSLGKIDVEQEQGKVSIICTECDFHWFNTPDKRMVDKV